MRDYKIFKINIKKIYNDAFSDYILNTMFPGVHKAEDFIGEEDE